MCLTVAICKGWAKNIRFRLAIDGKVLIQGKHKEAWAQYYSYNKRPPDKCSVVTLIW